MNIENIVQHGFWDFHYSAELNTILVRQAVEYLVRQPLVPVLSNELGTTEKVKPTAVQLVSAIEIR